MKRPRLCPVTLRFLADEKDRERTWTLDRASDCERDSKASYERGDVRPGDMETGQRYVWRRVAANLKRQAARLRSLATRSERKG
jgi:hypothetical protein